MPPLPPSRISGLIQRIEAGETVTQKEVDALATLQVLDIAKYGEDFVRERVAWDTEQSRLMESVP